MEFVHFMKKMYLLVIAGNQNNDSGICELCMTDRRQRVPDKSSAAFLDRKISHKLSLGSCLLIRRLEQVLCGKSPREKVIWNWVLS